MHNQIQYIKIKTQSGILYAYEIITITTLVSLTKNAQSILFK